MKNLVTILFTLLLCFCSNNEIISITSQIELNQKRNDYSLERIEYAVEGAGNRKPDIEFLNKVQYLIHLKDSLNLELSNANQCSYASFKTYVDTLEARFVKNDIYALHQNDFITANQLIDKTKKITKNNDIKFHLALQVSYLESLLFEKYVNYIAIEDVE